MLVCDETEFAENPLFQWTTSQIDVIKELEPEISYTAAAGTPITIVFSTANTEVCNKPLSLDLKCTPDPDAYTDYSFKLVDFVTQKLKFTDSLTPSYPWVDKEVEMQIEGLLQFKIADDSFMFNDFDYKKFQPPLSSGNKIKLKVKSIMDDYLQLQISPNTANLLSTTVPMTSLGGAAHTLDINYGDFSVKVVCKKDVPALSQPLCTDYCQVTPADSTYKKGDEYVGKPILTHARSLNVDQVQHPTQSAIQTKILAGNYWDTAKITLVCGSWTLQSVIDGPILRITNYYYLAQLRP